MTSGSVTTPAAATQGELLAAGVKELTTTQKPAADQFIQLIERLASNPDVDVAKIERIIDMQERILRFNAEAAFNEAFATMQPEIPVILEHEDGDGGKWTYAPIEDIVEPLRPILARHGFSLSHNTVFPDAKTVKVIGILTHRAGHSRQSEFQSAADQTGSKNAVQSLGSTNAYGRRYTTKDLLCIVTRKEDDDGRSSDKHLKPEDPDGFEPWFAVLESTATEGRTEFDRRWNDSPEKFRKHLADTAPKELARLRTKASKAGR